MSFIHQTVLSEQDSCLYRSGADSPERQMDRIQISKCIIFCQVVTEALKSIRECKGVGNYMGSQEKVL